MPGSIQVRVCVQVRVCLCVCLCMTIKLSKLWHLKFHVTQHNRTRKLPVRPRPKEIRENPRRTKRNIVYIKSYRPKAKAIATATAKAIAKCFKCQARCLFVGFSFWWRIVQCARVEGGNFQLRFVPKCERSNFCCALRRVCLAVRLSACHTCVCEFVYLFKLFNMSCASCYNNNKHRVSVEFCTRQIKQQKNSRRFLGRAQKNLHLGALSMNETRVFITHFSAVVALAIVVVVVGAAVRVDCRVCRNQKVQNFGQTDLLAGENKYESENEMKWDFRIVDVASKHFCIFVI